MDRNWIQSNNRNSAEYIEGVKIFMSVARNHMDGLNRTRCPCRSCNNVLYQPIDDVEYHLFLHGFGRTYTTWIHHGEVFEDDFNLERDNAHDMSNEEVEEVDAMQQMMEDIYAGTFVGNSGGEQFHDHNFNTEQTFTNQNINSRSDEGDFGKFLQLLKDMKHELYPGCKKFSKLFLIKLLNGSTKDMLFHRICDRFDIQVDRQDIREGINKFLGARFKSLKYHMHRHFKSFKTNVSEARRNPYDGVSLEDWQKVCDIFEDPKYKEKCQKNANNRKKLLTNHCGGSKPFVRARFEMRDENTGEESDMVTFYKKTHYRESNGSWATQECERMHEEMVKLLEPQDVDETSMSEPVQLTPDEAFYMTYKSKSGYVKGVGHGQAPVRNMRRRQVEVAEARRRADEAQQRASDVEAQLRDQAEEMKQQKQEIIALRAQLSKLDDMMNKFLSSQMPSSESQPNDGA